MEVEKGVSSKHYLTSDELDDDGRIKRTGMLSLSLPPFLIFTFQIT